MIQVYINQIHFILLEWNYIEGMHVHIDILIALSFFHLMVDRYLGHSRRSGFELLAI